MPLGERVVLRTQESESDKGLSTAAIVHAVGVNYRNEEHSQTVVGANKVKNNFLIHRLVTTQKQQKNVEKANEKTTNDVVCMIDSFCMT